MHYFHHEYHRVLINSAVLFDWYDGHVSGILNPEGKPHVFFLLAFDAESQYRAYGACEVSIDAAQSLHHFFKVDGMNAAFINRWNEIRDSMDKAYVFQGAIALGAEVLMRVASIEQLAMMKVVDYSNMVERADELEITMYWKRELDG